MRSRCSRVVHVVVFHVVLAQSQLALDRLDDSIAAAEQRYEQARLEHAVARVARAHRPARGRARARRTCRSADGHPGRRATLPAPPEGDVDAPSHGWTEVKPTLVDRAVTPTAAPPAARAARPGPLRPTATGPGPRPPAARPSVARTAQPRSTPSLAGARPGARTAARRSAIGSPRCRVARLARHPRRDRRSCSRRSASGSSSSRRATAVALRALGLDQRVQHGRARRRARQHLRPQRRRPRGLGRRQTHLRRPARDQATRRRLRPQLAPIVGVDAARARARLRQKHARVRVRRRKVDDRRRRRRCARSDLAGIGFVPESKRFYPSGTLAAPVLGFVGTDNDGLGGLEDRLRGDARRARRVRCRSSATRRATTSRGRSAR